jgi:anti-sigma factor RsiW
VRALAALAAGELPPAEQALLEEHARGCETCGARLSSLRAQRELLRAQAEERLAQVDLAGFTERVLAAVAQDTHSLPLQERAKVASLELWRARPVALVAGCAAACLAFATFTNFALMNRTVRAPAPELLLAQAAVDFVEFDGQAGVVLEAPGHTTAIWFTDAPEEQP